MLPVQAIIRRVRFRLHDMDDLTYDEEEILEAINQGLRLVRRAIADIRPSLLMSEVKGTLEPGQQSLALEKRPTKIVHVTAGDEVKKTVVAYHSDKIWHNWNKIWHNHTKIYSRTETVYYHEEQLAEAELARLIGENQDQAGCPAAFCLVGMQTLRFFPIPERVTAYTVITIDDAEELTAGDASPLNTEYDDCLIEYAALRLSYGNEYDMAQEAQLMANIYAQVQQLTYAPPPGLEVDGYWDSYDRCKGQDYRHYRKRRRY